MKKQQPQNWRPIQTDVEGKVFDGEYCIEAGCLTVRYGEFGKLENSTHSIGPGDKAIARLMLRELVDASKETDL